MQLYRIISGGVTPGLGNFFFKGMLNKNLGEIDVGGCCVRYRFDLCVKAGI